MASQVAITKGGNSFHAEIFSMVEFDDDLISFQA
jgi:hypothetical protein